MRLQRAGEIDYYEELGVATNASSEQIHESFRALVRILHPDRQRDEQLKSIAEIQLRKINRIYAVLSDPERRRRYDESLEDNFRPEAVVFRPGSNIDPKQFVTRLIWIGAAILAVAVVIWFATDPPAPPVLSVSEHVSASSKARAIPASQRSAASSRPQSQPDESPSPSDNSSYEIAQLRGALRAAWRERDEAKHELAQLRAQQALAPHTSPPPPAAVNAPSAVPVMTSAPTSVPETVPSRIVAAASRPPLPSAVPAATSPVVRTLRPPGSDPHQFAGFWFFARSAQASRNKNLYPPEFIEATLTELNGVVHGKYRSRYRIVDRAISPDVNFEFTGTPTGGSIACAWTGPGRAKGQLTLQMTGENDIKVDWTASDMGSIQGLASGTATLTRRLD